MLTLFLLMNLVRMVPLVQDPMLDARAQVRADYLCEYHQWSHDGWLDSFKGLSYKYAGENLSKGFDTDVEAFNALMQSQTHRENIQRIWYSKVGIGHSDKCDIDAILFEG